MSKESVLIVGTVSNVSKVILRDFDRVYHSLKRFQSISTFLVESDSTDNTREVLHKMKKMYKNFDYVELGVLKKSIPDRIDRIRYCRNEYVNHIRSNYTIGNWDYVVVVDLDGMNNSLTAKSVNSCFDSTINWDACFANQKHGYYDLYALRHNKWMPNNCFDDLAEERAKISIKYFDSTRLFHRMAAQYLFYKAKKVVIYKKMRILKVNTEWIKVQSAFGGFAIYKSKLLVECNYDKLSNPQSLVSEHVDLNTKLISKGYNLFINPKLINSNWNTYNVNRYFFVRFLRHKLKDYSKIIKIGRKFFLLY